MSYIQPIPHHITSPMATLQSTPPIQTLLKPHLKENELSLLIHPKFIQ